MRILLDECVNAGVRAAFPKHAVRTVAEMGWQSRKDRELLLDAERVFDVFVTIDRKIERQQDLTRFRLGFVIARVQSNLIAAFLPIFEQLRGGGTGQAGRDRSRERSGPVTLEAARQPR